MEPVLQRLRGEQLDRDQYLVGWTVGGLIGLGVALAILLGLYL